MVQEGKAYVHAALALYYAGSQINEDNLKKVIEALGLQVDEAKVKMLVASLSQINIDEVLKGAAVVAAPAAAPVAAPASQPAAQPAGEAKKEEAKEEKKEASEVDISEGLAGLFGM
ncbi:MAG: 50S ribosomal protein P1 [Acidilobus sp.]